MHWLLFLPWGRGLMVAGAFSLFIAACVLLLGWKTMGDERPWFSGRDQRGLWVGFALWVVLAFVVGVLIGWGD